jgi:hypothetical protein
MGHEKFKKKILEKHEINLSFNVDGIPIFKSSSKQFWPLSCRIHIKNVVVSPFAVAIFSGDSKPFSVAVYLQQFIEELNNLTSNGFEYNGDIIPVKIKTFSCDAPARAFLKCIKGHTGNYACERCNAKGQNINRRIVYLESTDSCARTHENFVSKMFPAHHLATTPLVLLKNFDLIMNVSLDAMHLCYLGIMRKMMVYWIKGGGTHAARLCVNLRLQLSNRIADSAKYVPNDFNRKPRPLIELDRYKATEFRFIVLYLGPIVLKGMLSQNYYKHFLLFHCAIRILSTVKFIDTAFINTAKELLIYFVQNCENFYGTDFCVYNTHSLIHLADDVKYHKEVLDELSCFIFENFLGSLKSMIRRPNRPCAQICNRMSEKIDFNFIDQSPKPVQCNSKKIQFSNYEIIANNARDSYVLLKGNTILKVLEILKDDFSVMGTLSNKLENFYEYPLPSSSLGIFKFTNFSLNHVIIDIGDILSKCFVVKCDNYYVACELLH